MRLPETRASSPGLSPGEEVNTLTPWIQGG